jgi:hypothetical protein
VERHRVEIADEPGPEHRDRTSLHEWSSLVGTVANGCRP